MAPRAALQCWLLLALLVSTFAASSHPLRLSLCQIEYSSDEQLLSIELGLFVMDVNDALVFDPYSTVLALAQPNESADAERLLLDYLNEFFQVRANGERVELKFEKKWLKGEGDDTTLRLLIEHRQAPPLETLQIRNAVFTDLFFDQTNIVYVHVDDESRSLMFSKKTPVQELDF